MPRPRSTLSTADLQAARPDSLRILHYPHPALRTRALPIPTTHNDQQPALHPIVAEVANRMIHLMQNAPGIGLAAPQVGLPWRLFVAHVPKPKPNTPEAEELANDPDAQQLLAQGIQLYTDQPTVYINPTITAYSKDLQPYEEGCLSLPDIHGTVRRPSTCTINATNLDAQPLTQTATGLLARCWQHELDHLDAILITDKFSLLDKRKAKRDLQALEHAAEPL